jgi:hypothetical protein
MEFLQKKWEYFDGGCFRGESTRFWLGGVSYISILLTEGLGAISW